jgi:hypothetical protein
MLQELLTWLPQDATRAWLPGALACAAGGLFLWAMGARVGRSVFTLAGVAVGAWGGLIVRQRLSPEVEPMGLACGGALVLGLAGYLLYTMWVGLTLGTLLCAAGALIAWKRLGGGASWSVPVLDLSGPVHVILRDLWASLPGVLPKVMPLVVCGCFASGVMITVMWPKLGRVLAFAAVGTLMFVAGGVAATAIARPEWLAYLPGASQTQGVALAVLVTAGAMLQWAMLPVPVRPAAPPAEPRDRSESRQAFRPRDVRGLGAGGRLKLTEARA